MIPPEIEGSKFDEDPMQFIEECYRIVAIIGVPPIEKAELMAYQQKGIGRVWFDQWVDNWGDYVGPLEWEEFKVAFFPWLFLSFGAKGGQSSRIHQSSSREYECEGVFPQVHKVVQVCALSCGGPEGEDEYVHIQGIYHIVARV